MAEIDCPHTERSWTHPLRRDLTPEQRAEPHNCPRCVAPETIVGMFLLTRRDLILVFAYGALIGASVAFVIAALSS
jgi:hypothetical protein